MTMATFVDFLLFMACLNEGKGKTCCWLTDLPPTCYSLWLCTDCTDTAPPLWIPSRHVRSSMTGLPIYLPVGCQGQYLDSRLRQWFFWSSKQFWRTNFSHFCPSFSPNLSPHVSKTWLQVPFRGGWTLMRVSTLIMPCTWVHVKMLCTHYPLSTSFLVGPYLLRNPIIHRNPQDLLCTCAYTPIRFHTNTAHTPLSEITDKIDTWEESVFRYGSRRASEYTARMTCTLPCAQS